MSSNLDQIIRLLPTLRPEELATLKAHIAARASLVGSSPAAPVLQSPLFIAVGETLRRMGLPSPHPKSAAAPELAAWFRGLKLRKADELSLMMIGVEALILFLRQARVPITSKNLVLNAYRIPALIDRDFPGYIQAGLIHLILGR